MTQAYLRGYMHKHADNARPMTLKDIAEIHAKRMTPGFRKSLVAGGVTGASVGAYTGREDMVKALRRALIGGSLGALAGGGLSIAHGFGKAQGHAEALGLLPG